MSRCVPRGLPLALLTAGLLLSFFSTAEAQLAPTNVSCVVVAQDVQLSWTNGEAYDFIEIRRDSVLIVTLPGVTTAFFDFGVPASFHLYSIHGVIATVTGQGDGCQVQVVPPPLEPPLEPPPSLKLLPPPMPSGLFDYVKDMAAATRLGKAFFWDMQAGSDGLVACATCHYHAGADNRSRNQLNPGPDGTFQVGGPNYRYTLADFPFHRIADVADQNSALIFDSDDASGDQGVHLATFIDVIPGSEEDDRTIDPDPTFSVAGLNVRQATGRNAPSVINAIYNLDSFWDGRANFWFNGRNIDGFRDTTATVLHVEPDTTVVPVQILIDRASLASQAVGPVVSGTEMSAHGRDFFKVAKKLLNLEPLQFQQVHANDSVLGPVVDFDGFGLNVTYVQMIQDAFQDEWWSSDRIFDPTLTEIGTGTPLGTNEYSMMEANFTLFWGLAILVYESTLVSDDSPFDKFQEGDLTALTPLEFQGMDVLTRVNCMLCHATSIFTSANASKLTVVLEPEASALEPLLERMPMKDFLLAVYDGGFYNLGLRPTTEDIGRGGTDQFGNPISVAGWVQLFGPDSIPFENSQILNPAPLPFEEIANAGAFKTPSLRNTELTGPYFHNGSYGTLEQVIDFYARGGNFANLNVDTMSPVMLPLPFLTNDPSKKLALRALLGALTDERVRMEMAPFDHPQLFIPDGAIGSTTAVTEPFPGAGFATDRFKEIPAIGAGGRADEGLIPLLEFLQPLPISNFTCSHSPLGAQLSWVNADLYPLVRIERDGVLLVVLPGASESFTDPNFTAGSWDYDVYGVDGTQIGLHNVCTVGVIPAAVTGLTATQLATGVSLGWTNADPYDSIDILRDGSPLVGLAGSSTVYVDLLAVPGVHTYGFISTVEGVDSPLASTSLTVFPAPLAALTCAQNGSAVDMAWFNGGTYDSIEVLRDGAPLATLLGTDSTFQDPAPPSGVNGYVLFGRTNGIDSPSSTCSLTITPTAISGLVCGITGGAGSLSWTNGDTYTQIAVRRNGLLIATLAGTATSHTDPGILGSGPGVHTYTLTPSTEGVIGIATSCGVSISPSPVTGLGCNAIPTGNLLAWTNAPGYDLIELLRDGAPLATVAGTQTFFLDPDLTPGSRDYQVIPSTDAIPATSVGCTVVRSPLAVTALTCADGPAGVALAWTNPGAYDEVRVNRNGSLLATLPGSATSFLDPSAATGVTNYSVRSFVGGLSSATAPSCNVSVLPAPVASLNCALVDPCGSTVHATWTSPELYDTIQISIDGTLTQTVAGNLQQTTIVLPGPGTYALSFVAIKQGLSSSPSTCSVTVLDNSASPPTGLSAIADPTTCAVTFAWTVQGSYSAIEIQIDGATALTIPGSASGAILTLPAAGTHLACVIASTDCGAQLAPVCATVSCSAAFIRGDVNGDGQHDISDPVSSLLAIFGLGPVPTCQSAADTNDDGVLNIADAIAGLSAIFGQGAPPAAPFPACGSDPTPDVLDCPSHAACP